MEADEIQKFVYFKNLELNENDSTENKEDEIDINFFKDSELYDVSVKYSFTYDSSNQSRKFTIKLTRKDILYSDEEDYDDDPHESSFAAKANKMEATTCNIIKFSDTTTEIDNSFYKITFPDSSVELLSTNHELLQKYVELKKSL